MRSRFSVLLIILSLTTAARADVLHVAGAGSLASAFTDLLRRFPAGPDTVGMPEFGPSGLMREKIEGGADVDLFASADMAQARRLAVGHPERFVVNFTRNRLCAIGRGTLGLTSTNMLDRLLDPTVRLATSTPGADPAGDYAWAVFARAESVRAGARAALEAKAQQLYGGGDRTPLLVSGKGAIEGIFLTDRADVALGYCSGATAVVRDVPGLAVVPLPPELAVGPAYGMVVLDAKPVAYRFAAFVLSEAGQAILKEHGFDPVALVEPASTSRGVLIQRAGAASRAISPERIASNTLIKQIEQGAPADIFFSADIDWMDYGQQHDLIKPDTRTNLLGNRLVLVAPKDSFVNVDVRPGFDLAAALKGGRLAMGLVDAVPAGKCGELM